MTDKPDYPFPFRALTGNYGDDGSASMAVYSTGAPGPGWKPYMQCVVVPPEHFDRMSWALDKMPVLEAKIAELTKRTDGHWDIRPGESHLEWLERKLNEGRHLESGDKRHVD